MQMIAGTALVPGAGVLWQSLGESDEHPRRVLHIKSRQERVLSDDLIIMSVAHTRLVIRRQHPHGNRRAMVETPLFSGVVSSRGTLDDLCGADRTKPVANVICVAGERQIGWELWILYLVRPNHAPLHAPMFLTNGVWVRAQSRPSRGLEGVIKNRWKAGRPILQAQMLGLASTLEFEGASFELLA